MTSCSLRYGLKSLGMIALLGIFAAGCATFQPEDPPAFAALTQANDAIMASKQAGAADRFPDDFTALEQRYQVARGTLYACQEDKALGMARSLIDDANALANKRVAAPPPPMPANQPPVARMAAPSEGDVGASLRFDAGDSSDPDGDKLTYNWNFGDGKTSSFTFPVASHRFTEVGNYNVRLTVDDGRGGTDTASSLVRVVSLQVIRSDVLFDFNRATLKPAGKKVLDDIAQQMQQETSMQALLVGHTDSRGAESYNMGLSKRRAEAVRDYLIARGVAAERLTTEWKGESEPVASNKTSEGRAQNRRTAITLNPMPAMR